jgi:hypothetical protein
MPNIPKALWPASPAQLRADERKGSGIGRLDPTSTALGNVVTYTVPTTLGPGPVPGLAEQQWLSGYSGDLYKDGNPFDGKNWILSGGVQVVGDGNTNIEAFKIRIQFGSGGTLQEVIVNAAPQFELSLPSNTIKASIFTGKVHGGRFINAGTYRFNGMLHRGIPNGDAEARFLTLEDDFAAGSAINNSTVIIPAYAKRLQLMGDTAGILYQAGVRLIFEPAGLEYSGPELAAIKNLVGGKISIPAGCGDVRVMGLGGPAPRLPVFSWDIEI